MCLFSRLALKISFAEKLRKDYLATAWFIGGLQLLAFPVYADSHNALQWIKRMERAVEFTNYEGRMVYIRPGGADTFQIYHRVVGNEVEERLIRLDGEGAEIIRRNNELICIFPRKKAVIVETRGPKNSKQNPLRASVPGYTVSMTESYTTVMTGRSRVAGRPAVRIGIDPKDDYRYGYRLWLDAKTAMPLKAQLIDAAQQVTVEELRFTSIVLDKPVAPIDVQSSFDTESYTWVKAGDSRIPGQAAAAQINWKATDLPQGFMLTAAQLEYTNSASNPRMHLVYSDSIASVSVFVDIGVAASEQVEGFSAMGAANAYSVMHDGWLITAMGEVPAKTARRIAVSVRQENVR